MPNVMKGHGSPYFKICRHDVYFLIYNSTFYSSAVFLWTYLVTRVLRIDFRKCRQPSYFFIYFLAENNGYLFDQCFDSSSLSRTIQCGKKKACQQNDIIILVIKVYRDQFISTFCVVYIAARPYRIMFYENDDSICFQTLKKFTKVSSAEPHLLSWCFNNLSIVVTLLGVSNINEF